MSSLAKVFAKDEDFKTFQSLQKIQLIEDRFSNLSKNIKEDNILPLKRKWDEPTNDLEQSTLRARAFFHLSVVSTFIYIV